MPAPGWQPGQKPQPRWTVWLDMVLLFAVPILVLVVGILASR